MKNRNIFSLFTLILVIFGLFAACSDASGSGSPDLKYTVVPGDTLYAKLQWLGINAASNSGYILEVTADESLGPQSLSYSGKNNIFIRLEGTTGGSKTITLSSNGSLFSIENGVTLILGENLALQGKNDNTFPLVKVDGTLTMNGGKISGNTNTNSTGGGVYVDKRGNFTMNGGEISDNTVSSTTSTTAYFSGGGVYVNNGSFTMSGGKISGNTAGNRGGGVSVYEGSFTMSGGEISGNTGYYGAVNVYRGSFTMSGGEISGNTGNYSGGVHMNNASSYDGGSFTMSGGKISGNIAKNYGGGVYVINTRFTMSGGEISGNTANRSGGGVCVYNASFTMSGGDISGNTANSSGGGVYVDGSYNEGNYIFTKSGGTITGYGSDMVNGNVVKNSSGVVQSNQGHTAYVSFSYDRPFKYRETTAGLKMNMDSSKNGAAGGWE